MFHNLCVKVIDADLILLLFSQVGAVPAEHILCTKEPLCSKTVNLVDKRDKISDLYTTGSFCLPKVNVKDYDNDEDLLKLALALVQSYEEITELMG